MDTPIKTVVYIEDDPDMIDLLRLILRTRGINLVGAVGGREGLETVRQVKPDLILLDLMMPEMNGWEVFQRVKAEDEISDTPIIIVTVKSRTLDRVLGLQVFKAEDYVTKPFETQRLIQSVCTVLDLPC